MSSNLRTWVATPAERRTAWIIASVSITLVIGAFAWPSIHRNYPDMFASFTQKAQHEPEPESTPGTEPSTEPELIEKIIAKAQLETPRPVKIQPEPEEAEPVEPVPKKTIAVKAVPAQKAVTKPVPDVEKDALPAGYYVQVGAFNEKQRAEALQKQLASKWNTSLKTKSNRMIAVWAGPYPSSKEAERIKTDIASRVKIKGFIVKN